MSYKNNLLLMADSYKLSHAAQYPAGTTKVYSYMEARKGAALPYTIFFGLQPYLEFLQDFEVSDMDIQYAKTFAKNHFGSEIFNEQGWQRIVDVHGGRLPLTIKAVKEGTKVPIGNVLVTIENNDPELPWLTNFVETFLMKVWYPITVASNSYAASQIIRRYFEDTSDETMIAFQLHDFGYRGVSSEETAAIGGAAHLTSFMGTDTLAAIIYANTHYNPTGDFKMYGFSVPASEHSTATPWGLTEEGETAYINNMLTLYPTGIVSLVADSKDTFRFAHILGTTFKDRILSRDGRVVVRPDSGDPVEVNVELIQILAECFGTTTNSKGYKVLPTQIRIIQGDGIDREMIGKILEAIKVIGFSAENIVFGSGGGLLQKFDRDTMRFAIKCSYSIRNGQVVNVQKDPKTAGGTKTSKAGMLKLVKNDAGLYSTVSSTQLSKEDFATIKDELEVVFHNGRMTRFQSFDEIRTIVAEQK
jgi:nicotinamide phosphoribosyltransferase